MSDPIAITVNGESVEALPGELVIDACERNGVYIPRFCYHSRMKPVGMCRMCLVEIDTGRGPALQPSCMIPVSPDMAVLTETPTVAKAQDGVLEFLLINHPLDCPVCDKGGECPLQDQTMAYGPGESRMVEEKRHYEKPIPISETVYLDRERCILCDRCTRFAKEVAGDPLIHFQGRGNQSEVNTFPDLPFSSYFSGNTVQICPVGALTAKPYRFKARPWDLDEIESTSTVDSVGSRITVQSSRNAVLRFLGVDVDAVNWGWLSDKERFGFEALTSEARLGEPLMRGNGLGRLDPDGDELVSTNWSVALAAAADALRDRNPDAIGVLGGARLTLEAQYAWAKLLKGELGVDNVDAQLGDGLPPDVVLGLPRATIDQVCAPGGVVVWLGPDPKEDLGTLYLRMRHAIVEDGVQLIEIAPRSTGLSPYAAHSLRPRPGAAGEVANALVGDTVVDDVGGVAADDLRAAAALLTSGAPVTVVLGRPQLAESAAPVVEAANAFYDALDGVTFLSALRRGNVHGALDMGLAPGLLPGRVTLDEGGAEIADHWTTRPETTGRDATAILEAAANGRIETLVLLGSDPLSDFPDRDLVEAALDKVGTLIAVDLFLNDSIVDGRADVVLAAAGPTEVDGTFVNLEGRASALAKKVTPPGTARADWIIAAELAAALGADLGLESTEQIWDEIVAVAPAYAGLDRSMVTAREGVLVPLADTPLTNQVRFMPPGPSPAAGNDAYSLRLVATRTMYDDGTWLRHCPSSTALAPGTVVRLNPVDFDRLGVDEGAAVKVESPKASVVVAAQRDAGVPRGSAAMPFNQRDVVLTELLDAQTVFTEVRVERS